MKQCTKCKEWKELSEFYKDKNKKDGLYSSCKKCNKEYRENNKNVWDEYYKNNRERILKDNKNWKQKNPEKVKSYHKTDRRKQKNNEYYKNNRERILKDNKIYRDKKKKELYKKNKKYTYSYTNWNSFFKGQIKPYEEIRQNGDFLEVKCTYCGKWFIPKVIEVKRRVSSIYGTTHGENRLYCSENCKLECPIFNKSKWPKGFKPITSREVQPELRQMVLERDNYTCQKCEKHQDELETGLHCHHIEGIHWNPIESADIDNCITLCKKCHIEVHKLPGCGYNDLKCKN